MLSRQNTYRRLAAGKARWSEERSVGDSNKYRGPEVGNGVTVSTERRPGGCSLVTSEKGRTKLGPGEEPDHMDWCASVRSLDFLL